VDNWVDLGVYKDQEPDIVFPGGVIEYTIEVWNEGPSDARSVYIWDQFPPEVIDVQWECNAYDGASCPEMADGTDYWFGDIDHQVDIPAGAWVKIVATGVRDPMSPVKYFENWASVSPSGCQADPYWGNNEDYDYNEPYTTFAPIIPRSRYYEPLPDLVVEGVRSTPCDFFVTIHNRGPAPVNEHFWVDVYIDPAWVPYEVNHTWFNAGDEGVVLKVMGDKLPIPAGESVTVSMWEADWSPTPYYHWHQSYVDWPVEYGSVIYAHVDSQGDKPYGRVREVHEEEGFWYNNISGPFAVEPGECEGFPLFP
jgi:uncharacterized repeat protein (TIGR01451 family)